MDIVDNGSRNFWVHVSFSIIVFSGHMPKSVISGSYDSFMGSVVAQLVENLCAIWENPVQILGREDPLEKG